MKSLLPDRKNSGITDRVLIAANACVWFNSEEVYQRYSSGSCRCGDNEQTTGERRDESLKVIAISIVRETIRVLNNEKTIGLLVWDVIGDIS